MATLTISDLPDALYVRLKARAAAHRRSLNSEAILAIERALAERPARDLTNLLTTIRRSRMRPTGLYLTDAELRSVRRAGRA